MDTLTAIQERRSVKHYDPEHRLSDAEIQTLMEHTILSPTSFNIQNWRIVLVDDPELRAKIRAVSWNQAQVTEASLLILLCADLNAWQQQPDRYWQNAPEAVRQQLVPMIVQFYEGRSELQRDEAMRSCGIAAQTLMLAAKSMGYDTCPMIGFDPRAVAELIQLPSNHVIGMMITLGKALQPARERGGQLPLDQVVIRNQFAAG
ncbi:MAG: nitroreductase family protein [Oscillatoriales cyanobacterium]|nr:MAG: nitroreductase family protein [Oscillatoriales cyanobacterium]